MTGASLMKGLVIGMALALAFLAGMNVMLLSQLLQLHQVTSNAYAMRDPAYTYVYYYTLPSNATNSSRIVVVVNVNMPCSCCGCCSCCINTTNAVISATANGNTIITSTNNNSTAVTNTQLMPTANSTSTTSTTSTAAPVTYTVTLSYSTMPSSGTSSGTSSSSSSLGSSTNVGITTSNTTNHTGNYFNYTIYNVTKIYVYMYNTTNIYNINNYTYLIEFAGTNIIVNGTGNQVFIGSINGSTYVWSNTTPTLYLIELVLANGTTINITSPVLPAIFVINNYGETFVINNYNGSTYLIIENTTTATAPMINLYLYGNVTIIGNLTFYGNIYINGTLIYSSVSSGNTGTSGNVTTGGGTTGKTKYHIIQNYGLNGTSTVININQNVNQQHSTKAGSGKG